MNSLEIMMDTLKHIFHYGCVLEYTRYHMYNNKIFHVLITHASTKIMHVLSKAMRPAVSIAFDGYMYFPSYYSKILSTFSLA